MILRIELYHLGMVGPVGTWNGVWPDGVPRKGELLNMTGLEQGFGDEPFEVTDVFWVVGKTAVTTEVVVRARR